jgi:hypothetical protein
MSLVAFNSYDFFPFSYGGLASESRRVILTYYFVVRTFGFVTSP